MSAEINLPWQQGVDFRDTNVADPFGELILFIKPSEKTGLDEITAIIQIRRYWEYDLVDRVGIGQYFAPFITEEMQKHAATIYAFLNREEAEAYLGGKFTHSEYYNLIIRQDFSQVQFAQIDPNAFVQGSV